MENFLDRPFLVGLLSFFTAVILMIVSYVWPHTPNIIQHLLLMLTVVIGVQLLYRAFIWRDIVERNREALLEAQRTVNELVNSASVCGLDSIFCDRQMARSTIIQAINGAREKVWLLGVAFAEENRLDDDKLLNTLSQHVANNLDVKLLLLDAFRSTDVSRTFLESPVTDAEAITNTDRDRENIKLRDDSLLIQRFYLDFEKTFNSICRYPSIANVTKYYTHNPSLWLVITDDIAYFAPYTYTFGRRPSQQSNGGAISPLMPILKFHKQSIFRSTTTGLESFAILEDHFNKLWETSDTEQLYETVNVELTIDHDFDSFSAEEKARVLRTLRELLDSPVEIPVVSIVPGSTKLTIILTREHAEQLLWLYECGVLDNLNIKDRVSKIGL